MTTEKDADKVATIFGIPHDDVLGAYVSRTDILTGRDRLEQLIVFPIREFDDEGLCVRTLFAGSCSAAPNWFGDAVMCEPALSHVRTIFPAGRDHPAGQAGHCRPVRATSGPQSDAGV